MTTCQKTKETAQQFLLRVLDARNKVFFDTQEEKSHDEYSAQLVQNMFLKTVEVYVTPHENESETKTLPAEVRELKSEFAKLKRNFAGKRLQQAPCFKKNRGRGRGQYQDQGYYHRQSDCQQCQAYGMGNNCQHCFNCRGIDHFRAQCTVQENSQQLFQGDEE